MSDFALFQDIIITDIKSSNTSPTFVGATTTLTVDEGASATDIKSLLHASDNDASQTETWSQNSAPSKGSLSFSSATAGSGSTDITPGGTITYTPTANATGSDSFIVQVSDGTATATRTISVTITDVNPDIANATVSLAENSANSTAVTTVTASNDTNGLTYAITAGNSSGAFAINSSTGAITVADTTQLNYEGGTTSYSLTVTVDDEDADTTADDTATITVNISDVNEAPSFTSGTTANFTENGTGTVYTATSSDPDSGATASYSIVGGADQSKFSVNSSTGVLTFVSAPDRENATDADTNNTYVVTLRVFDGTNTADRTVTVTVTDTNDTAPVIGSNGGDTTAAINVAENATAVTTVTSTDSDTTGTVTYSLSGGADQALFAIDANSGVLTFASGRNRESPSDADGNNTYVVVVSASDGTQSDTQTITVTITDVNEFTPTITSNGGGATAAVSVVENATAVTTVVGADTDSTASLSYSLSGGADQAKFSINTSTGVLTFASAPDYETPLDTGDTAGNNTYVVQVQVSDGTNTVTQDITVTVTDTANENPPVITSNGGGATAAINVAENTSSVTTVTATDADAGATQTYSIVGGADQAKFSVNSSTGVLTFVSAPDRENATDADTNNTYVVQVQVSDGLNTDTQTITVTVTDTNDTAPVIGSNGAGATAAINVAENATAVTTVTSTDADTTGTVTYSLSGGADQALFAIDANSGALTFASGRNRESPSDADSNNTYVVTVTASDGTQSDTQTITVTVTDVNEFTPAITSNGGATTAAITINENGTAVTTVAATDADSTASLTYSLVGGADQAKFNINPSTGVLTFVNAAAGQNAPDFEQPTDNGTNNTYVVQVRASDGTNTVDQTITVTVADVDEVAPNPPTLTAPNSTTSTSVPISGAAEANSTVKIYKGATLLGSVIADGTGAWRYTATLAVGTHSLTATATDAANNTSTVSTAASVTVTEAGRGGGDGGGGTGGGGPGGGSGGGPGGGPGGGIGNGGGVGGGTGGGNGGGNGFGLPPVAAAPGIGDSSGTGGRPAPIGDSGPVLTAPSLGAFQIAVAAKPAGGGDALVVNAPMRDAVIAEGVRIAVTIPAEAFAHTKADASVTLVATRDNGQALPGWMTFNPQTGTFEGTPPPGFKGEVVVKVVARDNEGREAVQTFKIQVGEAGQGNVAPGRSGDLGLPGKLAKAVGRPSLTEQLRTLGREGQKADRLALVALLQGKGRAA